MPLKLIEQLVMLKSNEEFSQWVNVHIHEFDDHFFETLESFIAQCSNNSPQLAKYLEQFLPVLKNAVSQSSGKPSSALPSSITQLFNEFQSGRISRSEALRRAEKIRLSDEVAFAAGGYLTQISKQKPLPQIALFVADILLIAVDPVKNKKLKGMLFDLCADIFQENPQTITKAIEAREKVLIIFEGLGDKQLIATTHNDLGLAYGNLLAGNRGENLKKAIKSFQQALEIYTKGEFPVDYAKIQSNLGITYTKLPAGDRKVNFQNAIKCYQTALEITTKADFPGEYARIQNNLGDAFLDLPTGDMMKKAIKCHQQALEVFTKGEFPVDYADTQGKLGIVYQKLPTGHRGENLKKAITCHQQALEIYTKGDFPVDYAGTQSNLGLAYSALPTGNRGENLKKAIACYQNALEITTKADFPGEYGMIQNNLGNAYVELPSGDRVDNLKKAIICYQEDLDIIIKDDSPVKYAIAQTNLGNAYRELPGDYGKGNFKKAIECYQNALEIYSKVDFPSEYAKLQNNLGIIYYDLPTGDRGVNLKKAIECCHNALQIYSKVDFPGEYATIQNNLGNAYSLLSEGDRGVNLKKAIVCYQEALKINTKEDFPVEYAMTQTDLGDAYFKLPTGDRNENLKKAIICYQQAVELRRKHKLWLETLETSNNFIRLYFVEKDWKKVLDLSQKSIDIYNKYWEQIFLSESRKGLSNLIFEIFRMQSYALFQKGRFLDAVTVLDKGTSRHLSETLGIGQELSEMIPKLIKKKAVLLNSNIKITLQEFKKLMKAYSPIEIDTLRDLLPRLKQEKAALLYMNVTSHGGFYALVHDTNLGRKDVFPLAKISDDAVKEFYVNEKQGWFTLYNQDRSYKHGKLFEQAEEKIQKFANQCEFNKILHRIEELEIKKLVILPQGVLHTFPFGGIKEIPEDLEICFSTNSQVLLNSYRNTPSTDRHQMSFAGFANPSEDARLFFTYAEVAYISSLMHSNENPNSKIRWGRKGNKQAISDDGQESTLLHFSTHGFYDPKEIENSYLLLFQDRLHLKDITKLKLSSCFMVVMSACDTGIPDVNSPGEHMCLSIGFHQAGAKVVVSSLWPMFDLSTSLLMGEFYRCFVSDGESPAYAMRRAQNWLRKSSPSVITDRLREYQNILKVEKEKLLTIEEPSVDSQINEIDRSLIGIESQINKYGKTNTPPFQNPYYWAGFVVNGWGF